MRIDVEVQQASGKLTPRKVHKAILHSAQYQKAMERIAQRLEKAAREQILQNNSSSDPKRTSAQIAERNEYFAHNTHAGVLSGGVKKSVNLVQAAANATEYEAEYGSLRKAAQKLKAGA